MNDQKKPSSIPIYQIIDDATGIITAFYADDYATVTQGKDADQVQRRLLDARNLIAKAREKYGFSHVSTSPPTGTGHTLSSSTYQVVA